MKKAMKQSTLTYLLNITSMLLLLCVAVSCLATAQMSRRVSQANTNRYDLTQNATIFMNASSCLTNEARAYAATAQYVHYENYWNKVNSLKNRERSIEAMKAIGIIAEEQQKIDSMAALSNQLVPLEGTSMEDVLAGRVNQGPSGGVWKRIYQTIAQINEIKPEFLQMLDQRSEAEVRRLEGINQLLQILNFAIIGAVMSFRPSPFW